MILVRLYQIAVMIFCTAEYRSRKLGVDKETGQSVSSSRYDNLYSRL
jgi:hypothetical protein